MASGLVVARDMCCGEVPGQVMSRFKGHRFKLLVLWGGSNSPSILLASLVVVSLLAIPHRVSAVQLLFQPGTEWVNNATARGDFPTRIVSSASFSFGFVGSNSTGFYLSVFLTYMVNDYLGGIVWCANRNNPVQIGATLLSGTDNNLGLYDANGTIIWYTDLDSFQVAGLELQESGNLQLIDGTNSTLWQSFDYPTDTLVLGQVLSPGRRIVSRAALTDLQEGSFALRTVDGGIVLDALLSDQDNSSAVYWGWGLDGNNMGFLGLNTSCRYGVSVTVGLEAFEMRLADSALQVAPPCNRYLARGYQGGSTTAPPLLLLRLGYDGNVHVYSVDVVMTDTRVLSDPLLSFITDAGCNLPSACGVNGICEATGTGKSCSCPKPPAQPSQAFNPWAGGCIPPRELDASDCGKRQQMAAIGGGFEYLPSTFSASVPSRDANSCQQLCLSNCSCVAALHRQESGQCFIVPHTLYSLQHFSSGNHYSAYLKVQSSGALATLKLSWLHLALVAGSAIMQVWAGGWL